MHRVDNSNFLLYIEPPASFKETVPIEDELTKIMEHALEQAKKGTANYSNLGEKARFMEGSGYRGTHVSACGKFSSNQDFLLENGMITNSLAPFYLRWYRSFIPESEMKKVKSLLEFYKNHV